MTTGTYTGAYTTLFNPGVASFTLTATGEVSSDNTIASVYVKSGFATLTNLGTIVNFTGTIVNTGTTLVSGQGVQFDAGGIVNNGSALDTTASISADSSTGSDFSAIYFEGAASGTVNNFGTILSTYPATGDTGIAAQNGVFVTNTGLIYGAGGGIESNLASSDTADTTIINSGTIESGGPYGYGGAIEEFFATSAYILNEASGLIESNASSSEEGILCNYGDGTVVNLGTIESLGTNMGSYFYPGGIYIGGHGTVTNGSASDSSAVISGYAYGVEFGYYASTLTNFGTISSFGTGGTTGYAVEFLESTNVADRLIDEPGAVFSGFNGVYGGGPDSVLELASGSSAGTIYSVGYYYTNFGTISVDSGAQWTLTGYYNTVSSFGFYAVNALGKLKAHTGKTTLDNSGTLTVESGVTLDLTKGGKLAGSGTIDVDGGTLDLGVKVKAANLDFTGDGLIEFKQKGVYKGIAVADFGMNDTIVLSSVKWSSHDKVSYASGLIKVKGGGGVLAKIAVAAGDGVTGVTLVDVGGKVGIEALTALLPEVSVSGFGQSHTNTAGADAGAFFGSADSSGDAGEADRHAGQLDLVSSIGRADHL